MAGLHSNPTQNERILEYMRTEGSITQLDALKELGVMRLASRISACVSKVGVSSARSKL